MFKKQMTVIAIPFDANLLKRKPPTTMYRKDVSVRSE